MTDKPRLKTARHLFVPAYGRSKEAGGNVVLNFMGAPKRELALIADEYFEAAKVLMDGLAEKGSYSDFAAYPIVFLYRHALELYLKALLVTGDSLAGLLGDRRLEFDLQNANANHKLMPLLNRLEQLFSALGWSWEDYGTSGLTAEGFRNIISEFDREDPDSYAFRYPVKKKDGTASVEESFAFSLLEMSRVLDPVLTMLSNDWMTLREYHGQLSEEASLKQELAYENDSSDYYSEAAYLNRQVAYENDSNDYYEGCRGDYYDAEP